MFFLKNLIPAVLTTLFGLLLLAGCASREIKTRYFDSSRKAGDVGVVETTYGCHLIYFVGPGEYSFRDSLIVNAKTSADYNTWYTGLTEAITPSQGLGVRFVNKGITLQSNSSQSTSN